MRLDLRIGVVIAIAQEARMFPRHDIGEVAQVNEHLLVCVGGVGAERAQAAAQLLLARGASALLSWGVAVALAPDLKAGCVLLPRAVIAADGTLLPVSSAWHEAISANSGLDVRPIAEARFLLATPEDKRAFGQAQHAAAADMESAAIGRVAQHAQVPFLIVRAIADDCAMQVPAWLMSCMNPRGQVRAARFFAQLLQHPRDAVAVARVARAFAAAQAALTGFNRRHLQAPLASA
jgi:adenosylhomocysteine nucleosidase